jgi:tellurite resistance protein
MDAVDKVFKTLKALKVFDPYEGVNLLNGFEDCLNKSPEIRRAGAMEAIRTEADDPENEELMIRIYFALSETDGKVSLMKQIRIITLCSLLELNAMVFGHYTASRSRKS